MFYLSFVAGIWNFHDCDTSLSFAMDQFSIYMIRKLLKEIRYSIFMIRKLLKEIRYSIFMIWKLLKEIQSWIVIHSCWKN